MSDICRETMRVRVLLTALACSFFLVMTGCDETPDTHRAGPMIDKNVVRGISTGIAPRVVESGMLKIVVKQAMFTREQLRDLESAAPYARFVFVGNDKQDKAHLIEVGDADALLTDWLTPELVRAGKKLKWIQYYAAGVDDIMFPELVNSNIVLSNCKIIQGPEIADHAFAMLLALTRRLNETILNQMKEEWLFSHYRERENWPIELNGRKALIIGLGGIGMQIAQRAHAFGMKVIALDPKDMPYIYFIHSMYRPDRLHEVLPQADVIFMTAPLTDRTRGMIGSTEFERMKRGAYFIALSRGKTFDTDALVVALKNGHISGAGLDVVEPWPLPKGHPLWKFGNVIITPHMSGQSDKVWDRRLKLFKENVRRFTSNEQLLYVVDKSKGY